MRQEKRGGGGAEMGGTVGGGGGWLDGMMRGKDKAVFRILQIMRQF